MTFRQIDCNIRSRCLGSRRRLRGTRRRQLQVQRSSRPLPLPQPSTSVSTSRRSGTGHDGHTSLRRPTRKRPPMPWLPASASTEAADAPGVAAADQPHQVALLSALTQVGVPYHRNTSKVGVGFDCSGLTAFAWGQSGVELARQQRQPDPQRHGRTVDTAQAGDLVYYPGHVMLWLGVDNLIVHAPAAGPARSRSATSPLAARAQSKSATRSADQLGRDAVSRGSGRSALRSDGVARPVRRAMISAQIEIAVSSGVRAPMSSPIGDISRSSCSGW